MKRILMVAPNRGTEFIRSDRANVLPEGSFPRALMAPIDLATLKALTPSGFEVDIWDESTRGVVNESTDLGKDYDLIACTGYMTHLPWIQRLAHEARRRGKLMAAGGPGVSGAPDTCRNLVDILFIGEAEHTWPQFLEDWEGGKHKPEYRQVQRPDIDCSPAPDWSDFPDMAKDYLVGPVQTCRGCPFDCDFCDVIHLFGRKARHKQIATVLSEVENLQRLGMRRIFFCDDNFIGQRKYARELVAALVELNKTFDSPVSYGTQLTIDLAKDEELLKLMADCNFGPVLIGVESPRQESLREANKPQNFKTDMVADLRKIQSFGVSVRASMIVGFDHDDLEIFDETFEFLQASGTGNPAVSMLRAFPGTPLLARLQREKRVVEVNDDHFENPHLATTNIIPKQMSRVELMKGTIGILERLHDWDNFAHRIRILLDGISYVPNRPQANELPGEQAELFIKFVSMLDVKAQTVIFQLMGEVTAKAPWMKEVIAVIVLRQAGNKRGLQRMIDSLHEQIERESAPDFELKIIDAMPRIPLGFKEKIQREAFPRSLEWLVERIDDARLVANGLIQVWRDFLIRWGETFTDIEDYHYEHLRELCDRTGEQANSGILSDGGIRADITNLSPSRMRQFTTEILVSVEQDLRGEPKMATVPLSAPKGRSPEDSA